LKETVAALAYKAENTAVGIRHADHVALSIRKKLALTSLTSGGRSVDIVRLRTVATEEANWKFGNSKEYCELRSPLWASGQSSWLKIQRSGFDSRCYHISEK
jgi:hypothetical protein